VGPAWTIHAGGLRSTLRAPVAWPGRTGQASGCEGGYAKYHPLHGRYPSAIVWVDSRGCRADSTQGLSGGESYPPSD